MNSHSRGQALMISVLIAAALVAVTVPIVIHLQRLSTHVVVETRQRDRAWNAVQDGVAFAGYVLSSTPTWTAALQGICPAEFQDRYGETKRHVGPAQNQYLIRCDFPYGKPLNNEVPLLIDGVSPNSGTPVKPLRTARVIMAHRSVHTDAVTAAGEMEKAAVMLKHSPDIQGQWEVHWGPIVCFGQNPWVIHGPMDEQRFPRKYSQGDIIGRQYPRSGQDGPTDQKEYFSRRTLGVIPSIDIQAYQAKAEESLDVPSLEWRNPRVVGPQILEANPKKSGYFYVDEGMAVLKTPLGLSHPIEKHSVVYIDGNVEFDDWLFDLVPGGALIIQGNLLIRKQGKFRPELSVNDIPKRAADEYPYKTEHQLFPCERFNGSTCSVPTPITFRGFLYVTGDLELQQPGPGEINAWAMQGVLRVDGQLKIPEQTSLTVYYHDKIAAGILGSNTIVVPLSVKEVPPGTH